MTRRSLLRGLALAVLGSEALHAQQTRKLQGSTGGDERDVETIRLCWRPAGRFLMGSPRSSAFRSRFPPEQRYEHIGFRVVAVQL